MMISRWMIGLLGASLIVAPAQAQTTVNVGWTLGEADEITTGWCTGKTDVEGVTECHNLVCYKNKLHYSLFFEQFKGNTNNLSLSLKVDDHAVHNTKLVMNFNSSTKRGFRSVEPLPATVVQQIASGAQLTTTRFGSTIINGLNNSGATLNTVRSLCQPPASNDLRSAKLDQLCRPFDNLMTFAGHSTRTIRYADVFFYRNRRGTNAGHNDTGRREFWLRGNRFATSVKYVGVNFGIGVGFKVDLAANNRTLNAQQKDDLRRIRNLALKYFEWRDIARQNNVRQFKKDFPDTLRPSISDHLNFNFQAVPDRTGKVRYYLQGMEAHGVCWLYQQALAFVGKTLPLAVQAIRAARQAELGKQRQQHNLNQKFQ